jgi:hypothetical protein
MHKFLSNLIDVTYPGVKAGPARMFTKIPTERVSRPGHLSVTAELTALPPKAAAALAGQRVSFGSLAAAHLARGAVASPPKADAAVAWRRGS